MADGSVVERFEFIFDAGVDLYMRGMERMYDATEVFVDFAVAGGAKLFSAFARVLFPLEDLQKGLTQVGKGIVAAYGGMKTAAEAVYNVFFKMEVTHAGMVKGLATGLLSITGIMGKMAKEFWNAEASLAGKGGTGNGGIIGALKFMMKVGGLTVLLGPILPFIRPFMSMMEMVMDAFAPAMEILTDTLTAALAPLAVMMERLAIKFLPVVLALIEPIIQVFMKLAEEVGKLLEGTDFNAIIGPLAELGKLLQVVVTILVDRFIKPFGKVFIETLVNLFTKLIKFAVEFVKTVIPHLPKFFDLLSKVAILLVTTLASAMEKFLLSMIDMLPKIMPLFDRMLVLFEKLFPAIEKLLPVALELFVNILTKFLAPAGVAALEGMINLLIKFVEALIPAIDNIELSLSLLNDWWRENEDIFERVSETMVDFWKQMVEGVKSFINSPEVQMVVKWVADLVDKAKYLLSLTGMDVEKKALEEKKSDIDFEFSQANVHGIAKQWDDSIARTVESLSNAGKTNAEIQAIVRRMEGAKLIAVTNAQMKATTMKAEGGYIASRQQVIVGERDPEWIVPDTPAGLAKYIPQMIQSVVRGGGGGAGVVGSIIPGASEADSRVAMLLEQIRDLLVEVDQTLRSQANPLPEIL